MTSSNSDNITSNFNNTQLRWHNNKQISQHDNKQHDIKQLIKHNNKQFRQHNNKQLRQYDNKQLKPENKQLRQHDSLMFLSLRFILRMLKNVQTKTYYRSFEITKAKI